MLPYRLGTIEASEALLTDLYIDLRRKVNAWSEITYQTPQARMGYIGQHLVSVVTGFPGGKSGARGYDLVIDKDRFGEIKTCYRVDQLGVCNCCKNVVSSLESVCTACGSTDINRRDDSKWLISLKDEKEFSEVLDPYRYYFVLFEFANIKDEYNNDIEASIWEVDPHSKGFAFCMIDYYLNIRAKSKSKAPFNMWPHQFKFALTKPRLIYKAIIKEDGAIETIVFPSMKNSFEDELKVLTEYGRATTISTEAARKVLLRLTGEKTDAYNAKECLQRIEDYRKMAKIPNGVLCDLFAEEIYLPSIRPIKKSIPANIRACFPELR